MNGKFKALGLALFAVLAMSAMSAASASASFHAGNEHVFLSANTTTSGGVTDKQVFKATPGGNAIECNDLALTTETSTNLAPGGVTNSVTVGPTYSDCTAVTSGGTVSAFVDFKKCHYKVFSETTETEVGSGKTHANVQLTCDKAEEEVEIKVTALKVNCAAFKQQTVAHAAHFDNITDPTTGKKAITLTATAKGIHSTTKGSCKVAGEPDTHTNGVLEGNATITAHETVGNGVDIWEE